MAYTSGLSVLIRLSASNSADQTSALAQIATFTSHPALLGYLLQTPTASSVSVTVAATLATALKLADPNHIVIAHLPGVLTSTMVVRCIFL